MILRWYEVVFIFIILILTIMSVLLMASLTLEELRILFIGRSVL